jgi:hypothetical protein
MLARFVIGHDETLNACLFGLEIKPIDQDSAARQHYFQPKHMQRPFRRDRLQAFAKIYSLNVPRMKIAD